MMRMYIRSQSLSFVNCLLRSRNQPAAILQTRLLYEQTRSGSVDFENKKIKRIREKSEIERLKKNIQIFKKDLAWAWRDLKTNVFWPFNSDDKRVCFDDGELVKMWDFNQANNDKVSSFELEYKKDKYNDLNNWLATCDSDYDLGYSTCSWTVSPSGYALFSGNLDRTLPKDGKVVRTGYAYVGAFKSRRPFGFFANNPQFEPFTHIVLRVRGDGRKYFIVLDTSDVLDITWFDRYQFMLYTHGGPYWQYVKIPLTRFYFHYQGFVQDRQTELQPQSIRSVGILAYDLFSGPFRLEIDYIGFVSDLQHLDSTEYETYFQETSQLRSYGSV